MKYLITIIFLCFMNSSFANEKEFVHARPDTSGMIIEVSGLLKVHMKQCSFSAEETQKINQYLVDIREVVHFYDGVTYQSIDAYAKQSEDYYTLHEEHDCDTVKEHLSDMINFSHSVILENLYMNVQHMPKKDLNKLDQEYIYSHKFVSPKFTEYNAGQNKDGTTWIGVAMPIEQCHKKEIRTKESSMPTYCDNGYAKILVYIPEEINSN